MGKHYGPVPALHVPLQYEKEHKEDLKDVVYYLPPEAHALGWQQGGANGHAWAAELNGAAAATGVPRRWLLGETSCLQVSFLCTCPGHCG